MTLVQTGGVAFVPAPKIDDLQSDSAWNSGIAGKKMR